MDKFEFIHNTIIHWIDKTDTKANIILGIKLFLTGYFLTLLEFFRFTCNWKSIFFVFFSIFSVISFIFIIKIIFPILSTKEPTSLIYFKHISDKYSNNKKQGIKDLSNFSDKEYITDISNQIISLSQIAEQKYINLQRGIIFMIAEAIILVIFKFL